MLMTSDQLVVICNQYNLGTCGNKASRSYSWAYEGGSRESDEVEEVDEVDEDDLNAEGAELVGVIFMEEVGGRWGGRRSRKKKKKK